MGNEYPADLVDAAVSAGFEDLADVAARIKALAVFRQRDDYQPLTAAFKRACNIVKEGVDDAVDPTLFSDEAERTLYEAFLAVREKADSEAANGSYIDALAEVASIKGAVDAFFDSVMVMAEDEAVRRNRLALLTKITGLFAKLADFTKLSS